VTDKGDAAEVASYLKAELVRHCAYKRTKKGEQDVAVMTAIEKYEKSGEDIVTEENIGEYSEGKFLVDTVIEKIEALKANGTFTENNLCVPQIIVLTPDT
jgi:hypothetical protein